MRLLSDDRKRDVGKERPCKAHAFSCWDCVHCVNGATYSGADHNLTCSNLLCNLLIPISCIELQGKQRIPWIYLHTIVTSCCTYAWIKRLETSLERISCFVRRKRHKHCRDEKECAPHALQHVHLFIIITTSQFTYTRNNYKTFLYMYTCECPLKVCEPCSFQLHLMPSVSCDWLLRSSESFRCILMQKITGA